MFYCLIQKYLKLRFLYDDIYLLIYDAHSSNIQILENQLFQVDLLMYIFALILWLLGIFVYSFLFLN